MTAKRELVSTEGSDGGPEYLYKYYKVDEYSKRVLTHDEIFFAPTKKFNDPFDTRIHYLYEGSRGERKAFLLDKVRQIYPHERPVDHIRRVKGMLKSGEDWGVFRDHLKEATSTIQNMVGVFSMSEVPDNILMWAHYAGSHTGFCVGFDMKCRYFMRALQVAYSTELPSSNVLHEHNRSVKKEKLLAMLVTKAINWDYEREWRMVEHGIGVGVQPCPPEGLVHVILGCWMSPEDKECVLELCSKRDPSPTVFEARIKEKEYGLDIVAVDG